jgi:hypothetical protein
VDGSFLQATGQETVGARGSEGTIILSTYQRIPSCDGTMDAEASAVLAGQKVLGDRYRGPLMLETDRAVV